MASWISRSTLLALACSIASVAAAATQVKYTGKYQMSVYYGQNAAGQSWSQKPLDEYCSDTNVQIIPIGFVTKFNGPGGVPVTNFANACGGPSFMVNGVKSQVLNCQGNIGAAMQKCKSQYGTKFLISLGGATYNEGGWPSRQKAEEAAQTIFAMFGPTTYRPYVNYRPFGKVVVDGYDLDFESNTRNLEWFATKLRALLDQYQPKQGLLTAAPQCPYPDANVGAALNTGVFDAVFIQFYNNYCSASTYNHKVTAKQQTTFNMASWQAWADQKSKRTKLFVGFVADPNTWGYVSPENAAAMAKSLMGFANFGGVMVWDMSLAKFNNPNFLRTIQGGLGMISTVKTASVAKPAVVVPPVKNATVPKKPAVKPVAKKGAVSPSPKPAPKVKAIHRRHVHHHARRRAVYHIQPISF